MNRFEIIKFLHVLAVVVWVGGGVLEQFFAVRASRSSDPGEMMRVAQDASWASQRFFMPASFAALGFGIWLVVDSPWSFGDLWIILGLVGYALSAGLGMGFLGPLSKRIATLSEERGAADPGVQQTIRRLLRVARLDLLILTAVIFDMVVKPGL